MPIEIKTCIECGRIYPEVGADLNHFCNYDAEILSTEAELNEAVEAERRELLRLITEVIVIPPVPKKMLIEAIIARGK